LRRFDGVDSLHDVPPPSSVSDLSRAELESLLIGLCCKAFGAARTRHNRCRIRGCGAAVAQDQAFKGRQFTSEVIVWAVRWYLMFPISYRDLELMLSDRGVAVNHTTIFRWIQAYAAELEKRIRPHLKLSNGSWRVDETYIKVKGRWTYLYRAVDSRGQTIDFLLSAKRDAAAAKRFFRKALAQPHTVNPRTITVDKNPAFPKAVTELKDDGELWRRSRLRQVKYLNNIVEQDHRRIKRLTRPGLGFGGFWTARRTLAGFEAMAMIRKGQIRNIRGDDIRAQANFIARMFRNAA
jgi:transposase-like protein